MKSAILLAAALTLPPAAAGAAPADDFAQNCANCHTIGGGRLTGPDLKDVAKRRSPEWLRRYLPNPKAMLDAGDPAMAALFKDYRGVLMPTLPAMTPDRVDALLKMIDEESKLPKSRFAGSEIISRPLLPADVADGQALFIGTARLKNGGPACASCHSVGGMRGLGGGALGPDLTLAYARIGGPKPLAAWLVAPAAPTMRPVYAARAIDPAEILPLVAFLEDSARKGRPADAIARLAFLVLGLVGAAAGFVALDALWARRLRAVRRPLAQMRRIPSEALDV